MRRARCGGAAGIGASGTGRARVAGGGDRHDRYLHLESEGWPAAAAGAARVLEIGYIRRLT